MNSKRADLLLASIALMWGASYIFSLYVLKELDPLWQNALRFIFSFIFIAIISFNKIKNPNRTTLKYSLIIGSILVVVYTGAIFGLKYTTLTNAAFLSCLTVLFVPIFSRIFYKTPIPSNIWVIIAMATVGVALLTLDENFSIQPKYLKGDLLCLMCSASYANHLLMTERAARHEEVDIYQLGTYQLLVCGVINLILAFFLEPFQVPVLPSTYVNLALLIIFCTVISYLIQPIAQKYTTASHAGIIYTLEPVSASILGWIFLGEVLNLKAIIGIILLITSILYMELYPSLNKKNKEI